MDRACRPRALPALAGALTALTSALTALTHALAALTRSDGAGVAVVFAFTQFHREVAGRSERAQLFFQHTENFSPAILQRAADRFRRNQIVAATDLHQNVADGGFPFKGLCPICHAPLLTVKTWLENTLRANLSLTTQ